MDGASGPYERSVYSRFIGNDDGEVRGLYRGFAELGGESELHGRFADLELGGVEFVRV